MGSRHHNSHLRTGQQKPETLPLLSWEAHSIQPPLLPESEFHLVPTMSPVSFKWKTGYNWRGWSMSDTFTRAAKEWGKGVSWDGTNHMGNSSDIDRKWGLCLFVFNIFIYLSFGRGESSWCRWAFPTCGKWGLLFVGVCRLLIAVVSLAAEHRL